MIVKPEMMGFRHEALSRWHRGLGPDFPALDLDFALLEYDQKEPCALIEYKLAGGKPVTRKDANLIALSKLATRAGIPAFFVRYCPDFTWFRVSALNQRARSHIRLTQTLTESQFKHLMSEIRRQHSTGRQAA